MADLFSQNILLSGLNATDPSIMLYFYLYHESNLTLSGSTLLST